ncbi:hypothetical protein SH580_12075 [Coraliomargarita algicola]|uniref:Glycosyltransferase RgtA/B/C/D-like domain-containing protein n=1 Tax=Coraliomargarita algicola TaxID=3092156 RepID=A0ABZ0RDD6_9BACT|nr:hypothetical protein [Coraliomargarita sp. J2-16]WPJ94170.1 hypothetical protein SH580_12075 [Coraliomargarita sp. J2-16]
MMDEPVLMATALQMHTLRESKTAAKAYQINGNFEILTAYTDKRPTLFPFIVSQVHALTGYRATQGIWLNTLLTPVFLSLLFYAGGVLWNKWGGYMAVVLFSTVPLLAMNMCGSGFELLNMTLLLATALAGYGYLKQSSADRANLFVMFGLLLAHTRYESALYIGAIGLVLCLVWWRQRQIEFSWAVIVAPLLLISLPLRRIIHSDNALIWQLDAKGVTSPFSIEYVKDNLSHALNYFFAYDLEQANSLLLSILFAMALVLLGWLLLRRRVRIDTTSPLFCISSIFGVSVLGSFILLMCYFWGQVDDVMATRIILPFILLQVLLVVWGCSRLPYAHRVAPVFILGVAMYFLAFSRPLMAQSNFLMPSIQQQEFKWTFDYVASRSERPILFISKSHMAALIQRRSALVPDTAIRNKLRIDLHLKLHTFDEILIVQFVPYSHTDLEINKLLVEEFERNFETETVVREKINNHGLMRVDRIVGVKMDAPLRARALAQTQELFQQEDDLWDFYQTLP